LDVALFLVKHRPMKT